MRACCGIVCTECDIYLAAQDKEKAEALAKCWRGWGDTSVQSDWFTCKGCHGDEALVWSGDDCKIRVCCKKEKGLENCSQCDGFPCELITAFKNDGHAHHRWGVEALRELRKS
ncbi:MAG: DUF3795 domain-containing protein [Armatimonadota bacterium]